MFQGIPAMMVSGGGSVQAPTGWTQRASDNFSSGVALADLTTSGNWTAHAGTIIYSAVSTAQNGSGAVDNLYSYSGASFLTAQYSQHTLVVGDGSGNASCIMGPAVRLQPATNTGYLLMYTGTNLVLLRYTTGTGVTVATTAKSYSVGTKLRIEAVGAGSATRLSAYEDTGSGFVAVHTSIDPGATYLDNGKPGIWGYNARIGWKFDDWSAGDQ